MTSSLSERNRPDLCMSNGTFNTDSAFYNCTNFRFQNTLMIKIPRFLDVSKFDTGGLLPNTDQRSNQLPIATMSGYHHSTFIRHWIFHLLDQTFFPFFSLFWIYCSAPSEDGFTVKSLLRLVSLSAKRFSLLIILRSLTPWEYTMRVVVVRMVTVEANVATGFRRFLT